MSAAFDIDTPAALLDALDEGEARRPLPADVANIVDAALRTPTRRSLAVAERALRVLVTAAREDRERTSQAVVEALRRVLQVKATLRQGGQ